MESIKKLYKIGKGPSSSHTMGPVFACEYMLSRYKNASCFEVVLYGSLSKTGKGHLTDKVIKTTLGEKCKQVIFDNSDIELPHPNTMLFEVYDDNMNVIAQQRIFSVGGGKIQIENADENGKSEEHIYPHNNFEEIKQYCEENNLRLWEYVKQYEGEEIFAFLDQIYSTMKACVKKGLSREGELFGGLNVQRKAKYLFNQRHMDELPQTHENRIVCAYAFAVSEENASAGTVVTAPTCGACGVLPAVLIYMQEKRGFTDFEIAKALSVGGLIGNIIKQNASISGAQCGCQAEIGSACSMASAALAELFSMDLDQIEYAAEVAMEHHLGLTCDPIKGLVQIPCIERNAVAAMRAINAVNLANFLTNTRKISFDVVVKTMYETGLDLFSKYKETSEGGLAKIYIENREDD